MKKCPICNSKGKRNDKLPDGWVNCVECDCEAPYKVWQQDRHLGDQLDSLLEQWARLNKVADKFTLRRLEDAGEEWQEFCATMNALVCSRRIQA